MKGAGLSQPLHMITLNLFINVDFSRRSKLKGPIRRNKLQVPKLATLIHFLRSYPSKLKRVLRMDKVNKLKFFLVIEFFLISPNTAKSKLRSKIAV